MAGRRRGWPRSFSALLRHIGRPSDFGELPFIQVVESNSERLFRDQLAAGMAENR